MRPFYCSTMAVITFVMWRKERRSVLRMVGYSMHTQPWIILHSVIATILVFRHLSMIAFVALLFTFYVITAQTNVRL